MIIYKNKYLRGKTELNKYNKKITEQKIYDFI